MSFSREQMRELMIDYLYGELDGATLEQFEAALSESEQSRRELAELRATLHVARAELARDAQAEPPARVRDAVLQAAHAQLAAARNATSGEQPSTHEAEARAQRSGAATRPQPMAAVVRSPAREELPTQPFLRWLRSIWILPSLVAAAAAALLVFKQDEHALAPYSSSKEVAQTPLPNSAADGENTVAPVSPTAKEGPTSSPDEPAARSEAKAAAARGAPQGENTVAPVSPTAPAPATASEAKTAAARGAADDSSFGTTPPKAEAPAPSASEAKTAAARGAADDSSFGTTPPKAEAPAPSARRAGSPRSTSGDGFATPPADWQRSRSATAARAPSPSRAEGAPTRDDRAPIAQLEAPEQRESAALEAIQNEESSALGSARQRTAAASPSARDSATSANRSTKPSAEAAAPAPLPAARLERRAREHIAAKRWPQAAADYRELLRRFPKDPQHAEWLKQLDLSERATTQPTPKD